MRRSDSKESSGSNSSGFSTGTNDKPSPTSSPTSGSLNKPQRLASKGTSASLSSEKRRMSLGSMAELKNSVSGMLNQAMTSKKGSLEQQREAAESLGIRVPLEQQAENEQGIRKRSLQRKSTMSYSQMAGINTDDSETAPKSRAFRGLFQKLGLRDHSYEQRFKEIVGASVWDDLFTTDDVTGTAVPLSGVHSGLVKWLDRFRIAAALWSVVYAPLAYGFANTDVMPSWLCEFDLWLSVLHAFSLLTQFKTSYLRVRTGTEVKNKRAVMRRRLCSPIFWCEGLSCVGSVLAIAGTNKVAVACFQILRAFALMKLPDSMWRLQHSQQYRLVSIIGTVVFSSHVFACLWFSVSGYREQFLENSPLFEYVFLSGGECPSALALYLLSYIEAVLMLTGSGIDDPLGVEERTARRHNAEALVVLAVMITFSCLLCSWIFSNFVVALQQQQVLETRHVETLSFIQEAMRTLSVPKDLAHRVMQYQHFQKLHHSAVAVGVLFDEKNMTRALGTEVRVFLYHKVLLNTPFFSRMDPQFNVEVVLALDDEIALPGDYLFRMGDLGQEMFFIIHGEVAILQGSSSADAGEWKALALVRNGDYLGESALLRAQRRTCFARVNTYCIVSVLERTKLDVIFAHFPEQREELFQVIESNLAHRHQSAGGSRRVFLKVEADKKSEEDIENEIPTPKVLPKASILRSPSFGRGAVKRNTPPPHEKGMQSNIGSAIKRVRKKLDPFKFVSSSSVAVSDVSETSDKIESSSTLKKQEVNSGASANNNDPRISAPSTSPPTHPPSPSTNGSVLPFARRSKKSRTLGDPSKTVVPSAAVTSNQENDSEEPATFGRRASEPQIPKKNSGVDDQGGCPQISARQMGVTRFKGANLVLNQMLASTAAPPSAKRLPAFSPWNCAEEECDLEEEALATLAGSAESPKLHSRQRRPSAGNIHSHNPATSAASPIESLRENRLEEKLDKQDKKLDNIATEFRQKLDNLSNEISSIKDIILYVAGDRALIPDMNGRSPRTPG